MSSLPTIEDIKERVRNYSANAPELHLLILLRDIRYLLLRLEQAERERDEYKARELTAARALARRRRSAGA
jgi:hypothetical protein